MYERTTRRTTRRPTTRTGASTRSGRRRLAGVAVVAVVGVAGCSGEDIAERIAENRIEAEAGEDVDIDLDLDGGNIRVETDEGTFEMNADGEGNVSIEGSGTDGDISIDSDDGVMVVEGEDGTATFTQGDGELPEGFPADIPLPDGLVIQLSQSMDMGGGQQGWLVVGEAPGEWQPYSDELIAALDGAGFVQQQLTTTPTGVVAGYERDGLMLFGTVTEGGQPGTISVSIQASTDG